MVCLKLPNTTSGYYDNQSYIAGVVYINQFTKEIVRHLDMIIATGEIHSQEFDMISNAAVLTDNNFSNWKFPCKKCEKLNQIFS